MDDPLDNIHLAVPILPRVALALAAVERTLVVLIAKEDAYTKAREGMEVGWKWELGEQMFAHDIYDHIYELGLESIACRHNDPDEIAILGVMDCLYYVTWHARRREEAIGKRHVYPAVPGDVWEVNEEVMYRALERARSAHGQESELWWQREAAKCLRRDYGSEDSEGLGEPVSREYFEHVSS